VYSGAAGAAGAAASGLKAKGEFGEVKIDGTAACGGGAAGAGGATGGSGVVNGSGYSGMVLAASENGFWPGR
jgi:hypothetical protein